jgi:hypothetical protein
MIAPVFKLTSVKFGFLVSFLMGATVWALASEVFGSLGVGVNLIGLAVWSLLANAFGPATADNFSQPVFIAIAASLSGLLFTALHVPVWWYFGKANRTDKQRVYFALFSVGYALLICAGRLVI